MHGLYWKPNYAETEWQIVATSVMAQKRPLLHHGGRVQAMKNVLDKNEYFFV